MMENRGGSLDDERVALSEGGSELGSEDFYVPTRDVRTRRSPLRRYGVATFVLALAAVLIAFAIFGLIRGRRASGVELGRGSAAQFDDEAEIAQMAMEGMPIEPNEDFDMEEGFFTIFRGTGLMSGVLLLAIPEAQLDHPFVLGSTWYRGNAETIILNTPVESTSINQAFAFGLSKTMDGFIDLYPQQFFISLENEESPLKTAYDEGTFQGWVGSFEYIPMQIGKAIYYLLNVTPWVLAGMDALDGVEFEVAGLRLANSSAAESSVRFDLDVEVAFIDEDGGAEFSGAGLAITLVKLPEEQMKARKSDERLGFFTTTHVRLDADRALHSKLDLIQKRNFDRHGGEITYVIDETIPPKWRNVIKEGVEEWNKAFAKIASKNAARKHKGDSSDGKHSMSVRAILPGDDDYPEDFRVGDATYNSISWSPSLDEVYALGPSIVDPRSGEILYSHIVITHGWVRSLLGSERLFEGRERRRSTNFLELRKQKTSANQSKQKANSSNGERILKAFAKAAGVDDELIVMQALKQVAMHEVGHTLGLRHNFHGSANYEFSKLSDPDFVNSNGLTSSVMDYLPPAFREKKEDQVVFYTQTLGLYDYQIMEYGYSPDLSEDQLASIGAESVKNGLHFGTDEDLDSIYTDPYTGLWDIGDEPMEFAKESMRVVTALPAKLRESANEEDVTWYDFTSDVTSLYRGIGRQLAIFARYVGGIELTRLRAGNGSNAPSNVISPELSKQALDTILKELDPRDGLFGLALMRDHLDVLVEQKGYSCDDIQSVCLGYGALDYVSLLREQREKLLVRLVDPDKLSAIDYAHMRSEGKTVSVSDFLTQLSGVLIPDDLGSDAVAKDSASHWIDILTTLVAADELEYIYPSVAACISGELALLHSRLTKRMDAAKEGEEKAFLWGLTWLVKDHALKNSSGDYMQL